MVVSKQVLLRYLSEKLHTVGDSLLSGEVAQRVLQGPRSYDPELGFELFHRADKKLHPFVGDQPSHKEHLLWPIAKLIYFSCTGLVQLEARYRNAKWNDATFLPIVGNKLRDFDVPRRGHNYAIRTAVEGMKKSTIDTTHRPRQRPHHVAVEVSHDWHVVGSEQSGQFSQGIGQVNVHQIGGPPVFYHGGYVYVSLFLTGEHRGYDLTKGAADGVHVLRPFGVHGTWGNISWGGIGAWELAVRWGYLNLDDPAAPPAANGTRPGGIVEGFTIGLNWYLNDHSRFMLNFSPATLVNPNVGTSTAQFYGIRFAAFW